MRYRREAMPPREHFERVSAAAACVSSVRTRARRRALVGGVGLVVNLAACTRLGVLRDGGALDATGEAAVGDGASASRDDGLDEVDATAPRDAQPNAMQVVELAAGRAHTCARRQNGEVLCWGDNTFGQLAIDGAQSASATPRGVLRVMGAVQLAAGDDFTCARLGDGRVFCWGDNRSQQVNEGRDDRVVVPSTVSLMTTLRSIAAGGSTACALMTNGAVFCWGRNTSRQIVNDTMRASVAVPSFITGLSSATKIVMGRDHTCVTSADTGLRCWGNNRSGQLGRATPMEVDPVPEGLGLNALTADPMAITAGSAHMCAAYGAGVVYSWGLDTNAQLGPRDVTMPGSPLPSPWQSNVFAAAATIVQLEAGDAHTCARTSSGLVFCWGDNQQGQVDPAGARVNLLRLPVRVPFPEGETAAVSIAAGAFHTCAAYASGAVYCWGRPNEGQTGLANTMSAPMLPVQLRL